MFSIGEKVINNSGVACIIKDITTLDMTGIDKTRPYYILSAILSETNTYYVPTDKEDSLRYVMTKSEAKNFLKSVDKIEPLKVLEDKRKEEQYKQIINSCVPEKWASLIKGLHKEREKRLKEGKRFTSIDNRYLIKAENSLIGELQVALEDSKDNIETMLKKSSVHW